MKYCYSSLLILTVLCCNNPERSESVRFDPVPLQNETDREWIQGWVSVSENRGDHNSQIIELPFVFSKVPDSLKTINTTVLIMSGGPGNSSLHMANGFTRSRVGSHGDVLVMDQRGTFYAKPYLSCPEIDSARIEGIKKGFFGQKLRQLHLKAVKACHDRWIGEGVDLDGYNTLESVEDIEDLRRFLDLDQLILYGMSYSCKLMSAYAMTYPHRVKALVLDSPLPHESNYDEEAWASIDGVFRAVVNYYSDENDLYRQWTDYVVSVQDSVFTIDLDSISFRYTSSEIIDAALNFLGDHSSLNQLPSVVKRLTQGDHSDVYSVLGSYLRGGRQAKGMRYSTWIAEELPDEQEDQVIRNSQAIPWLVNYAVNDVSFETAKNWEVSSIYNSKEWANLSYAGPVYILSGAFDPWTPVAYGEKMKEKFFQAELKIYPEHTHLPGFTRQGASDIYEFLVEPY